MQKQFENRLVAIVNKDIELGVAMNALAHATIGLGAQLNSETLLLTDYVDQNGNVYPHISQMPFIILKGKSGEIRKCYANAKSQGVMCGVFINTMTGGTYQEQLDNTRVTATENLTYYVLVLFGREEIVKPLTKSFSLYK